MQVKRRIASPALETEVLSGWLLFGQPGAEL